MEFTDERLRILHQSIQPTWYRSDQNLCHWLGGSARERKWQDPPRKVYTTWTFERKHHSFHYNLLCDWWPKIKSKCLKFLRLNFQNYEIMNHAIEFI
jgi:hypothetical protein